MRHDWSNFHNRSPHKSQAFFHFIIASPPFSSHKHDTSLSNPLIQTNITSSAAISCLIPANLSIPAKVKLAPLPSSGLYSKRRIKTSTWDYKGSWWVSTRQSVTGFKKISKGYCRYCLGFFKWTNSGAGRTRPRYNLWTPCYALCL